MLTFVRIFVTFSDILFAIYLTFINIFQIQLAGQFYSSLCLYLRLYIEIALQPLNLFRVKSRPPRSIFVGFVASN